MDMHIFHHQTIEQTLAADAAVKALDLAVPNDNIRRFRNADADRRRGAGTIRIDDGKPVQIYGDVAHIRPDIDSIVQIGPAEGL